MVVAPVSQSQNKYRFLIISIALFLAFDLGVLGLNFYTSGLIAEQTERINLAAQQRTLTQQMAKATLYIKAQKLLNWPYQSGLDELREDYRSFQNTMRAFNKGGEVISPESGLPISVPPISSSRGLEIMALANPLWQRFEEAIDPLMVDILVTDEEIEPASAFIAVNNDDLFVVMNDLTSHFKQESDRQTLLLRMFQVGGILLATINFFVIMFHFLRQIREREQKITDAKNESDKILNTIEEGVLLVDRDLTIGHEHSRFLKTLFATKHIGGRNFRRFLQNYFSQQQVDQAVDYINLYFSPHVHKDLVADINPLRRAKASVINEQNQIEEKFLNFAFSPLVGTRDDSSILVSIKDVTAEVELEKQTALVANKSSAQLKLLAEILPIKADELDLLLNECASSVKQINDILKSGDHDESTSMPNKIGLLTHKIKGSAAVLNVTSIEAAINQIESELNKVKKLNKRSGKDFIPITLALSNLMDLLDDVRALHAQISSLRQTNTTGMGNNGLPAGWRKLAEFAKKLSAQNGIELSVSVAGVDASLPSSASDGLLKIATQLLRNSIAHSFEPPTQRLRAGKIEQCHAVIFVSSGQRTGIRMMYQEDGSGFDFEAIRARIVASGEITTNDVAALKKRQLVQWTLKSGFSTREQADGLAGQGSGLALVKEIVKSLNGKMRIRFTEGELIQFTFDLPLDASKLPQDNATLPTLVGSTS